jgi:probable HAF family extracellular repeat protein
LLLAVPILLKETFIVKITCGFKIHRLMLAAALFAGVGFVTHAAAQEASYFIDLSSRRVIELGNLGGGFTRANGINDVGQVVGVSRGSTGFTHAFITGPDGVGMRDLGSLGGVGPYDHTWASGVNAAGQVVGESTVSPGTARAFITGANGMGMRHLGTLGGTHSDAYAINDTGQVVGSSPPTRDGFSHAFITGPNGVGMRDLGALGTFGSVAYAINDAGQVVGSLFDGRAFVTGPDGVGMRVLGTLGGPSTSAYDINAAGQVVGRAATSGGTSRAFLTGPNGEGMTDLGALDGDHFSHASAINNAGQVVGFSSSFTGPDHAFITGPNGVGMTDLNLLVDLPGKAILTHVLDINNTGQVIAMGFIPEPESYAMLLAGLGLIGFMARRKRFQI